MEITLSTPGKFHTFDLARELQRSGYLKKVYTGYPKYKLRAEEIPKEKISSFSLLHAPYMYMSGADLLGKRIRVEFEYLDKLALDLFVAARITECDVFVGLSGSSLRSAKRARKLGAKHVCDRGSTHIRIQDSLLRDESDRWGMAYTPIDPRVVEMEEAEYEHADMITVPSSFNLRSFIESGVEGKKLHKLSYGVNLRRFFPTDRADAAQFNVLFVGALSLRKGVPDLIKAFNALQHPAKRLTFVGSYTEAFVGFLKSRGLWGENFQLLGHVAQEKLKDIMSRSHVLVLPSIEEGLAMVQAQAMACRCPVIASTNTGCEDLFVDGAEGFIVPIRKPEVLAARMQTLADDYYLQQELAEKALLKVSHASGWSRYGEQAIALYHRLKNNTRADANQTLA